MPGPHVRPRGCSASVRLIAARVHAHIVSSVSVSATDSVPPAADPAQAAYRKWGWRKIAQKRNPLPGAPLFDVLVR
jgi:hypothetical protein